MPSSNFTLPVHYLRQIVSQLRGMDVDVAELLALAELDEARLNDSALSIGYDAFEKLVREGLVIAGEPALGLLVGERLLANTHGVLGYAAMNSGTPRQALELVERYVGLRISLIRLSDELHGNEHRLCISETKPMAAIRAPVLEAVILSVKNVLDAIAMGACPVTRVAFPFAEPSYASLAREIFKCEVCYGQDWAGFAVRDDLLDTPLKMADPETFREAALICQRELDKLVANESLAARVRRLLLEKQNGFPSLVVTSRLFHMTSRTLHRRLLDEGTSFKTILEEVRRTLAVEQLKSGRFSVEEIAFSLGYSDLANFRRAFKRWEKVSPSEYRSQHQRAGDA
jgi:AraC-like DNA-binding protein